MNNSRRNFIRKAGLGLMGSYLATSFLSSCNSVSTKESGPFAQIGLQLFTLRELLAQDAKLTLETISKIGYTHVETFGLDIANNSFWGLPLKDLQSLLADTNLQTFSGHYDMVHYLSKDHQDKESIEKYIETAHQLGQKYIIAPVPPMFDINSLTPADYQYAAEQLNKAGEMAQKAGIMVGFHNHFWELRQFANGTRGLDILIAFTDPELVTFELDVYWVEKAGVNPLSYFTKYPDRFHLWHIKDMDRNFTTPILGEPWDSMPLDSINSQKVRFTEVGSGSIDYKALASNAEKSGLRFAYVEQDEIYLPNKFDSVKRSFDYVQKNLVNIR